MSNVRKKSNRYCLIGRGVRLPGVSRLDSRSGTSNGSPKGCQMNDLQRKIILERARRRTAEEEIIRLRHALEEIRDLVRTGLKPDIYPDEESWNRSKLRSIVNMASVALQEVKE